MKRIFLTTLQAAVTLALLYWIFHDPEKRAKMLDTLRTAEWLWFVPGLLAIGVMTILQTFRWQWLLQAQEIRLSFRRAYGVNLIGIFFNLFLPGGTGGDLIKMYYVSREAPTKKAAAVLSVFMDRVVGLLALIALAAVVSLFAFDEIWAAKALRSVLLSLGLIIAGAIGFLLFVFILEYFHLGKKLPRWLPMRHAFLEMAAAFSTYARSGGLLWASFFISLPAHLVIFYSFYCAGCALTDGLTFIQIFTVLPIILTIAALPISVAGLGVREQLFALCLSALFGISGETAALIGFTGFLLSVAWGALGGIIYIFYRPSDKKQTSILEMEAEMEEEEVKIEDTIE